MTEKTTSAIEQYASALNELDVDAYVACFTKDAVVVDPFGSPPAVGRSGLREWFKGMTRTWDEFEMTLKETYASGGRVAVRWEVVATSRAGKLARFAGINVFGIDEAGSIASLEGYWDFRAMVQQIS